MTLLLVYAVTLLVGVLLSALAHRTVLSTAVLFIRRVERRAPRRMRREVREQEQTGQPGEPG